MKPIVVSAACAPRTPSAEPRVRAAPPCNKCRREILPKSIACSPVGGSAAGYFAAAPDMSPRPLQREAEEDVAMVLPPRSVASMFIEADKIALTFRCDVLPLN